METIAVSKLRANIMKYLKDIENGKSFDVTSRGKVVAKLIPPDYEQNVAKTKLKKLGNTAIIGDVISPINEDWEAVSK